MKVKIMRQSGILNFTRVAIAMTLCFLPTLGSADECQAKLGTAIEQVFASHPMRATRTVMMDGKPASTNIIEFVPPNRVRVTNTVHIKDGERAKAAYPYLVIANGEETVTLIGNDQWIGSEKGPSFESKDDTLAAKSFLGVQLSRSELFALACKGTMIELEHDAYGVYFDPSSGVSANEQRSKRRKDQRNNSKPIGGTAELDDKGRLVRLTFEKEKSDIEPKGLINNFVFEHDAKITIDPPR